jgi:hypothetical protein
MTKTYKKGRRLRLQPRELRLHVLEVPAQTARTLRLHGP